MVDSASRAQYYCYGRSQINGLSASPQRATKTSGKHVPREPLSELPGSGPLQGKLKPPARVSLSPTKLETVMAALETEPVDSPHVALACLQQAVEPKETRELNLEQRYASWFEMVPCAPRSPPGFHEGLERLFTLDTLRARCEDRLRAPSRLEIPISSSRLAHAERRNAELAQQLHESYQVMARLHKARPRQDRAGRERGECSQTTQSAQMIEAQHDTTSSPPKPLSPLACDMRLTMQALLLETQTVRPSIIASPPPVASRVRAQRPSETRIRDSLPTPPLHRPRADAGRIKSGCRAGVDTLRPCSVASPPVASQLRWLQRVEAEVAQSSPAQPLPLPLHPPAHSHKASSRLLHAMVRGMQAPARAQWKQRLPMLPARATARWDVAQPPTSCA